MKLNSFSPLLDLAIVNCEVITPLQWGIASALCLVQSIIICSRPAACMLTLGTSCIHFPSQETNFTQHNYTFLMRCSVHNNHNYLFKTLVCLALFITVHLGRGDASYTSTAVLYGYGPLGVYSNRREGGREDIMHGNHRWHRTYHHVLVHIF